MPQLTNLRYLTQGPKPTRRQPTPELLSILGRYMLLEVEKFLTFYLERIFAIFPSGSSLATRIKRLEGGVCWLATGQQPNTAILKGTTVPDNKLSQKSKYLSCDPERHRDRDSYSERCRGPSFGPHGPPQK